MVAEKKSDWRFFGSIVSMRFNAWMKPRSSIWSASSRTKISTLRSEERALVDQVEAGGPESRDEDVDRPAEAGGSGGLIGMPPNTVITDRCRKLARNRRSSARSGWRAHASAKRTSMRQALRRTMLGIGGKIFQRGQREGPPSCRCRSARLPPQVAPVEQRRGSPEAGSASADRNPSRQAPSGSARKRPRSENLVKRESFTLSMRAGPIMGASTASGFSLTTRVKWGSPGLKAPEGEPACHVERQEITLLWPGRRASPSVGAGAAYGGEACRMQVVTCGPSSPALSRRGSGGCARLCANRRCFCPSPGKKRPSRHRAGPFTYPPLAPPLKGRGIMGASATLS